MRKKTKCKSENRYLHVAWMEQTRKGREFVIFYEELVDDETKFLKYLFQNVCKLFRDIAKLYGKIFKIKHYHNTHWRKAFTSRERLAVLKTLSMHFVCDELQESPYQSDKFFNHFSNIRKAFNS